MDELTLFIELLKIDDPALRRARLDEIAGKDNNLRTRIDELLEAHVRASKFMDTSAHLNGLNVSSPAIRDVRREQPGDVIGPYKLLQVIGEGGMGLVFMAEQTKPVQRRVALKIIKAGMDSKSVIARFEAERQALAMMDHPNIAKVLDAGATGAGHPFFVMELVKGVEITKYCDEKRLDLKKRLELFISVCQAIQHAHQKGIIHRDIKPSNVLVAQYDGTPVPKVIDFGVAKATAQKLTEKTLFTEFGQVIGTIEYMSPEQAELNQLDIDTRSDVYSLGVLLYELLTGSTPLDGKQLRSVAYIEMLRMIREDEPSKPSAKVSTSATLASIAASRGVEPERLGKIVKGELDWIVMKALEKDRSRRYATSSLLAEDIGRYLNNEQILACPASLGYRLQKMTWKHRAALVTVAMVMVGLAVGLGIATWQAIRATNAEQLAESRFKSESAARGLADKATLDAIEAARNEQAAHVRATQLATDSRIQLARSHVAAGAKYMAEQKFALALHRFVEALRVNEQNKQSTAIDRLRIGMVLQQCPKPSACFQLGPSLGNKANVLFDHRGIAIGFKYCDEEKKSLQVFEIQTGKPISIVFAASRKIEQAVMSPDGRLLLAKSDDSVVWLWEIMNSRLVFSRSFEPGSFVGYTFSAKSDRLAFLHYPGNSQIVDTSNGQELATFTTPKGVNLPTFSPGGTELLWCSKGDTPSIHVWDVEHGIRTAVATGHSRFLTDLRFSHDGKRIVTASFDSTARVWDTKSLASLTPPMKHDDGVQQAFFSADDSSIITASLDMTTKIWNSKTGSLLTASLNHDGCVRIAASSIDGTLLVTAGDDATARVWNPDSSKLAYPVICHHQRVTYASFNKSGRVVMTATGDGLVQLWDLATTYPSPVVIDSHPAEPQFAAFTPDSKNLFVGGVAPRLWSVDSGAFASPVMDHPGGFAHYVAVAPNGRRFATFNYWRGVKVWDGNGFEAVTPLLQLKWNKLVATFSVQIEQSDVSFSKGAKNIVCLWRSPSSRVGMWDTSTGTQLDWPVTREEDVTCIVYSPDGNVIASASTNKSTKPNSGVLSLWDGSTGELIRPRINLELPVSQVRFSPDSQRLATPYNGARGGLYEVRILDIATGQKVEPGVFSDSAFLSVVFNHDGSRMATANGDHSIRVWNVATGKPLTPPMIHSEVVNKVDFSPNNTILLASCGNGNLAAHGEANVRLWDATTGQPISPRLHHQNQSLYVDSGHFSPDGHYIASSSRDQTTCIWALEECSLSSETLVTLAEILSGQRLDEFGSFSALNTDEMLAKWNEMATLQQHWFVASPKQTIAWKYHLAFELANLKKWEAAIDYFGQLLKDVPSEMIGLHSRRLEAALATKQWELAQEDQTAIARILGEGHIRSLIIARDVADALLQSGLVFEATSLMEKLLPIARKNLLDESNSFVLWTMIEIAWNGYESNGEIDKAKSMIREATALLRELIEQTRHQSESNPVILAGMLASLGENLLEQEEWSDSETALRECLTIRDTVAPDLWTTFSAKLLLGTSLLGQEKFDEAERLLATGWEGVISREQQIPTVARPKFSRHIKRVTEIYRALEKPEAAAAWQQKLDEFDGPRP